jgi:hypothetical protein
MQDLQSQRGSQLGKPQRQRERNQGLLTGNMAAIIREQVQRIEEQNDEALPSPKFEYRGILGQGLNSPKSMNSLILRNSEEKKRQNSEL